MKKYLPLLTALLIFLSVLPLFSHRTDESPASNLEASAALRVNHEGAEESFDRMMDVLTHQRCMNCHTSDHIPKQGEDRHPHHFGITRVNAAGATNCNTCHQSYNNDLSGVPGAPHWSLAPHIMRWEGLSRVEIARSMMNPATNGNRTAQEVLHHLTEDPLVLWAWEPGVDSEGNPRELPPVSKEDYIAAVKEWIESGALIPEETVN